jgi:5'-nucleotidase
VKKILITNDDGYESEGLLALAEALSPYGQVTVVAPSSEKSACGHSLTLSHPLSFISVGDDFYKLDDGTPSDCIYLALHSLFEDRKPDLVVSGINKGSNMGEDITYSGTAAGAMEAVLHGIPAIAVSQVMDFEKPLPDFSLAQQTVAMLVGKIFASEFPLPPRQFLNVNIPADAREAQCKITYAGHRFYANDAHLHRNPRGKEYFWLGLHPLEFKPREGREELCDFEAVELGHVSVSPIMLDLSAYESMQRLGSWLES